MDFFNKGILGKVSTISIFLFFIFFALVLVNSSVANPLVSSYDRSFICDGCENLDIPSDTDIDVFLNVSVVRFRDESEKISLVDFIPFEWTVVDSNGGKVVQSNYYKSLEWEVDLTKADKIYESDSYEILEIKKLYKVKSPSINEEKSFIFITRSDEEIGSTRVNVYPIEVATVQEFEEISELIESSEVKAVLEEPIELKPEQRNWKQKMERVGARVSLIKSKSERYTARIEKNNIIVEFEDVENVNWDETVELNEDVNEDVINEFLLEGNLKLKDFVWVEANDFVEERSYEAKITLPSEYESVFYCQGTKQNPDCSMIQECGQKPCYEEINGGTILYLEHFSGGGGADPTNQYNQDGSPYIANGTWTGGSAINLNTLGEGSTYDVQEAGTPGCSPNCPTNVMGESDMATLSVGQTEDYVALSQAYNLSKAFIVSRFHGAATTTTSNIAPNVHTGTVQFANTTHIKVNRESGTSYDARATWSIIQAENIRVCNFTNSWSGGTTGIQSNDIDMSSCSFSLPSNYYEKCFIEIHGNTRVDSSDVDCYATSRIVANITNQTNVNIQRYTNPQGCSSGPAGTTIGYVVCFVDSTNVTTGFQDNFDIEDGNTVNIGKTINTTNSFLTFNFLVDDDGLEQNSVRGEISSSTQMTYSRSIGETTGGLVDLRWYIIEFEKGGFREELYFTGSNSDTQIDYDFSNSYDENKTMLWCSDNFDAGEGTAYPRIPWTYYFLDLNTVRAQRGRTGLSSQSSEHTCQAIMFPSYTTYETGEGGTYNIDVWHNSTPIGFTGEMGSINVTINFTTDTNDYYSLQMYDWQNSVWNSTGCDSGAVAADTPTQWWCNISTNPMYYNSSDGIIRFRINTTEDTDQGILYEDYIQYYVNFWDYPPTWQNNYTSFPSGSEYAPGRDHGFQIDWTDPDQGDSVNFVFFEWEGNNYTPSGFDSTFYYNITDLGVGDYTYKWFANDSYGYWNNTTSLTYSVVANTSTQDLMNLTIGVGTSGDESNYVDTYPSTTNATGWYSSVFNGQDIEFSLYRNDTTIGSTNPIIDVETYGVGFYVYTYNTSGNVNYTSASKNYNLTIQQNTTNPINLYFRNSTAPYLNQNMTVDYEEQTNATGVTVYLNSGAINLFRDGVNVTDTENNQWITLGANADGYEYKANTSGNENYSANASGLTFYMIVNKKQTETYLWINDTRSDYGFTANDYANFTVELSGYSGKTVELWSNYSDGTWRLWDSDNSPLENITQMTSTGKFKFLGNYSGDENYTYSEESWTVTISTLSLFSTIESINPTSINQSKNSTVLGNCSCEGGTCNNVFIEIQADGNPIPSTSGGDLQVNGSSSYSLGQLSGTWATRSWNITGWTPGTYFITIKCNSTETGNSFSDPQNLEVNDTEYPTWSGNTTSPASGVKYLQGRQYRFNVTWDDNKEIDKILIEQNFSGGSPVNDTVTTNESDVYYYDVYDLPVGTYVWKEYANDTTDNWNLTDSWTFVVDQAATEVTLYLNESTTDQTSYYPNSTINATAVSNVSGLYVQLWRNGTLLANTTSSTFNITKWPSWDNNFTAQVLGNENYTSSSPVTLWWNISKGIVPLVLDNNETWSETYPTPVKITGTGCPAEITCNLYRNDSGLLASNEDNVLLSAGGYNYTYNTSTSQNYSANSTSNILEIVKGEVQPLLTINTTWTEIYPTATNVSCSVSSYNNEVICGLYRNDSSVGNPDEQLMGAGYYEYTANTSETSNYTSNSTGDVQILTVQKNPTSSISLFLNGSQNNFNLNYNTYLNMTAVLNTPASGNIEIWTNYSDGVWKQLDSCSGCSSLENISLMTWSGIWNITANFTHQNYSDAYESWYANVKDLGPPTFYLNSTNSTTAGTAVEHSLYWLDDKGLSGYIFSWNNDTNWTDVDCSSLDNQDSCQAYGCTWTLGADYNQTIMDLNPEARWIINSDGTDFADAHDPDTSVHPIFVTSIIPNPPLPNCGDFDGSTNQYNYPDHERINTGTGYIGSHRALSAWIVADTIDATGEGRAIWSEGGASNSMNMYVLNNGTHDNIYCNAVESANYDFVYTELAEGSFVHVGCMFDFAGGRMDMYINGTLVDSDISLAVDISLAAHSNDNALGGVDQSTDNHLGTPMSGNFDGKIADVVYWSDGVIINQSDFQAIYEAGESSGDCSGTSNYELKNDTWVPMTGATNWSNITKIINETEGATIKWCVYANDTSDNWNGTSCLDPFSYVTTLFGYLEVLLVSPPGNIIVEAYKNFTVNATVYCRDGVCGDVYGNVRYNLTSANPDTLVNTTYGDQPFFINESPAYAIKTCYNNMMQDDFCNVTWNINATTAYTEWKMGVLFNSSYIDINENNTDNITITIIPCIEEMAVHFSNIGFGDLIPSTDGNDATENSNDFYNVTNSGSCLSDIWIKATDLVNETDEIRYANISFNNNTDDYASSHRIANNFSSENSSLMSGVSGYTNVTGYFYLDVPATYAKLYSGNVTVCLNSSAYPSVCE